MMLIHLCRLSRSVLVPIAPISCQLPQTINFLKPAILEWSKLLQRRRFRARLPPTSRSLSVTARPVLLRPSILLWIRITAIQMANVFPSEIRHRVVADPLGFLAAVDLLGEEAVVVPIHADRLRINCLPSTKSLSGLMIPAPLALTLLFLQTN